MPPAPAAGQPPEPHAPAHARARSPRGPRTTGIAPRVISTTARASMVASRPPPGTIGTPPPPTTPRRSPRPNSTVPPQSTPRTVADPHAGPLPGGQAKGTSPAKPDPNAADQPSQPPSAPVLRRPRESTQYVCIRYTERLVEAGIEPSVGSVGDSYDNALAETVIGLF